MGRLKHAGRRGWPEQLPQTNQRPAHPGGVALSAQHRWPGFAYHQIAASIRLGDRVTFIVDNVGNQDFLDLRRVVIEDLGLERRDRGRRLRGSNVGLDELRACGNLLTLA